MSDRWRSRGPVEDVVHESPLSSLTLSGSTDTRVRSGW